MSRTLVAKLQEPHTCKIEGENFGASLHLAEKFRDPFYLSETIREVIEGESTVVKEENCAIFPRAIFTKTYPQIVGSIRAVGILTPDEGASTGEFFVPEVHRIKPDVDSYKFEVIVSRKFDEIHSVGIPQWKVKRNRHQIGDDAQYPDMESKYGNGDDGFEEDLDIHID
jgi:hypothetical protein